MTRQALNNGSWFDKDASAGWNDSSDYDATEHEELYRTKSKRWVLHRWSQWEGTRDSWEEIDAQDAARWLVRNGHDHPDVAEEIAALEI